MKTFLTFLLFVSAALPATARGYDGGSVSWRQQPTEATGWYWMYDDAEATPPFLLPEISPISEVSFKDIVAVENHVPPYNDSALAYPLQDSFWYYGTWYKPTDKIYISLDGWVSFDSSSQPGAPNPPLATIAFPMVGEPNALIAPLWQDNNLVASDSQYHLFEKYDPDSRTFIVEWHEAKSAVTPSNSYTYELELSMGGQDKLVKQGDCGTVFSYHFIHFLYETTTNGWIADNGRTGIENQDGTRGVWYQGTITDGRIVRAGYKKVFKHDVAAYEILRPHDMVLRWSSIEPKVVVANLGQEAEHFGVSLDIYDEAGIRIFHNMLGGYDLSPGIMDTIVSPSWMPMEIGSTYEIQLYVSMGDNCTPNDTLTEEVVVGCDDTLRYLWNFSDGSPAINIQETRLGAFYAVDSGVLLTGGRVYLPTVDANSAPVKLEIWKAQSGCGEVSAGSAPPCSIVMPYQPAQGWNNIPFPGAGFWVNSSEPGGIWAAVTSGSNSATTRVYEYGMGKTPSPSACYQGQGLGRGGTWLGSPASGFGWGGYSGSFYTVPVELSAHLGFGAFPLPAMPCPPGFFGEAMDVSACGITNPGGVYVEDGVPVTPEIMIANLGREKEPKSGYPFPVKFFAVDMATSETTFTDQSLVSSIGWLGNNADNPDTLMVAINPWTPEGRCAKVADGGPFVELELIGLVNLGVVGPDESDHCPYNDTIRRTVTVLLVHDVGVTDLIAYPDPTTPPDKYNVGDQITFTATVENFGKSEEHDVPVHIEIWDKTADPDTLVWQNTQLISVLDWRGNTLDNPYTADVTFPVFTVPNLSWLSGSAKTELEGDMCPDDDIGPSWPPIYAISENPSVLKYSLDILSQSLADHVVLSFAAPHSSWVKVSIFDINGRFVTNIQNDPMEPGYHTRTWNGRDNAGRKCPAGIYLVRMEAEGFTDSKKIVILR